MLNTHNIRIAGTTIYIAGDNSGPARPPPSYRPFCGSGQPQIRLDLHRQKPPVQAAEKIFASPPIWSLYRHGNLSLIKIFDELDLPGYTLIFDDLLRRADLYPTDPIGRFSNPFDGPTMELMMINYLARGRGVILHACGIARDGRGYLFAGESGAGKSTLARLWDGHKGVTVLSDDRTIVRKKDGRYWMYGTPWHGEAEFGAPHGVILDKIFFLRHGSRNAIQDVRGVPAVTQFLKCSFPPYWDVAGMNFAMEFFSDLTTSVACQALSFTPDSSVIDLILK